MGFSREKAVEALEKSNYNLSEVYVFWGLMLTLGDELFT